jgi:hypothetical protein
MTSTSNARVEWVTHQSLLEFGWKPLCRVGSYFEIGHYSVGRLFVGENEPSSNPTVSLAAASRLYLLSEKSHSSIAKFLFS